MSDRCNLIVNGRPVSARLGETLIDAALGGSIVVPHDCRTGQCETCRVTVLAGRIDDQGTAEGRTVLACQATLAGHAEISFDEVPAVVKRAGIVAGIASLSPEVIEVVVALAIPLDYRPGQYVRAKFSGFPGREYSPTVRLDGTLKNDELVFHIRRLPGGLISTQLGATIRPGHRVQVTGPFGQGFLRDDDGPLVLVAGGTGWAPIWSLARAARSQQRHRDLVVIAGSRDRDNLYMRPALEWLIDDGVRDVIATAEVDAARPILPGRPTRYLPSLGVEDTVYVAGPPGLVDTVRQKARAAAARCYADPFLPSAQAPSLVERVMSMLRAPAVPAAAVVAPAPMPRWSRLLRPLARGGAPGAGGPAPAQTTARTPPQRPG
jgi:NAD(P)H-flavin reductase/ferredoxin